jgi:flagellar biosynthesis/type III secretory pathway M-ring protein FliF/YscJ
MKRLGSTQAYTAVTQSRRMQTEMTVTRTAYGKKISYKDNFTIQNKEAGSTDRTQQIRLEPSLETLWLQNIETMDKVQRIDRSCSVPSSKTFRDEQNKGMEKYNRKT